GCDEAGLSPYDCVRIFSRDRTNIPDFSSAFFEATTFDREDNSSDDPSGLTSTTWKEVGMGQVDAVGQAPSSSVFESLLAGARGGMPRCSDVSSNRSGLTWGPWRGTGCRTICVLSTTTPTSCRRHCSRRIGDLRPSMEQTPKTFGSGFAGS